MLAQRETYVSLTIGFVAILVIVGGFASFTGMSVYSGTLQLVFHKQDFSRGDVFDVDVLFQPVQMLAEESATVYIDGNVASVISVKKYLDDERIDYAVEYQNLGAENAQIINLKDRLYLNLADFVPLENLEPGRHDLRVALSEGEATAEGSFTVN